MTRTETGTNDRDQKLLRLGPGLGPVPATVPVPRRFLFLPLFQYSFNYILETVQESYGNQIYLAMYLQYSIVHILYSADDCKIDQNLLALYLVLYLYLDERRGVLATAIDKAIAIAIELATASGDAQECVFHCTMYSVHALGLVSASTIQRDCTELYEP